MFFPRGPVASWCFPRMHPAGSATSAATLRGVCMCCLRTLLASACNECMLAEGLWTPARNAEYVKYGAKYTKSTQNQPPARIHQNQQISSNIPNTEKRNDMPSFHRGAPPPALASAIARTWGYRYRKDGGGGAAALARWPTCRARRPVARGATLLDERYLAVDIPEEDLSQ